MCNREDRIILFNGQFYSLSPLEYGVFKMLILNADEVVTREKLLRDVWGYTDDVEIMTRSVDMCIQRLRNKVGAEHIETVYGVGYKLIL